MLYWGIEDDLAVVILALTVINVYYALAITKIAKGAPRGWYVIIAGFVAVFIFRAAELYFDVQSPSNTIDAEEAAISILAALLFVVGLIMLNSSFRKRLKASGTS